MTWLWTVTRRWIIAKWTRCGAGRMGGGSYSWAHIRFPMFQFLGLTFLQLQQWEQQHCGVLGSLIVCFFFVFSRAAPVAHGGSQARGSHQSYSHWSTPGPQQHQFQAASASYTTAHGNAGSLIHWARPRIEPTTSWFLVRFVNHWATMGTPFSENNFLRGIYISDYILLVNYFVCNDTFFLTNSAFCLRII